MAAIQSIQMLNNLGHELLNLSFLSQPLFASFCLSLPLSASFCLSLPFSNSFCPLLASLSASLYLPVTLSGSLFLTPSVYLLHTLEDHFVRLRLYCVRPGTSLMSLSAAALNKCENTITIICGTWWLIGTFVAFRPKGRGFESRSSLHVRSLGKSFTRSCLWRFGMELRHSIRAVSGAPLSGSALEEVLYK